MIGLIFRGRVDGIVISEKIPFRINSERVKYDYVVLVIVAHCEV